MTVDSALELPPRAFETLMAHLAPEAPEEAGRKYLRLQDRLIRFFEWRGATTPDELAFETLRRLAIRLSEGVELEVSLGSFAMGFARNVLREHWRLPLEAELPPDGFLADPRASHAEAEKEKALRFLETCAKRLGDAYDMLLRFHAYSGRRRIDERLRLAEERGKTVNALRIEAFRRRREILDCMKDLLGSASAIS